MNVSKIFRYDHNVCNVYRYDRSRSVTTYLGTRTIAFSVSSPFRYDHNERVPYS
jgi:hypothetical protein